MHVELYVVQDEALSKIGVYLKLSSVEENMADIVKLEQETVGIERTLFKQGVMKGTLGQMCLFNSKKQGEERKMLQLLQGVATWGTPHEKQLFTCH